MEEKLIPLSCVLKWIESTLSDERVLDDYRGTMVRGVQASYTSIEELKEDITNIANEWNANKKGE